MIHYRASFGAVVVAISLLYLWLIGFPLRQRQAWAWWTLLLSGAVGFASFLGYLGYGYLDTWHAAATLILLPCYAVGLYRSRALIHASAGLKTLLQMPAWIRRRSADSAGRACLLTAALGITGAGLTILAMGMTVVFVPQDLAFLGVRLEGLRALNPRLVPLIAHDRRPSAARCARAESHWPQASGAGGHCCPSGGPWRWPAR
jgi:hypothetical protein